MSALWALALILLCSGVAKLRSREDVLVTFTRLRVPAPLARPWLARAFPWLEVLLALALVQPLTPVRLIAGVTAAALFLAFLVLVARAQDDGVSCGCFGEASAAPISRTTIRRNVLFLILAAMALAEALVAIAARGVALDLWPLDPFGPVAPVWGTTVAVVLAASAVLVGRESVPTADTTAPSTAAADDAEPPRHPIPDAPVVEGTQVRTLHQMLQDGPIVALRLSPGCGSCAAVISRLPEFAAALGPVRPRVLVPLRDTADHAPGRRGRIPPGLALDDPAGVAATSVGLTSYPSAVLLGADGLTAGGPVFGAGEVIDLLEEVVEIVSTELPPAAMEDSRA